MLKVLIDLLGLVHLRRRKNNMGFWEGFEKQAQATKEELKHVLKKHEERETSEQEKAESKREEEIEQKAGVEK